MPHVTGLATAAPVARETMRTKVQGPAGAQIRVKIQTVLAKGGRRLYIVVPACRRRAVDFPPATVCKAMRVAADENRQQPVHLSLFAAPTGGLKNYGSAENLQEGNLDGPLQNLRLSGQGQPGRAGSASEKSAQGEGSQSAGRFRHQR